MSSGGFMGTPFSNDAISTSVYSPVYAGTLLSETDEAWSIEATARPDVKTPYSKLIFTISKKYLQPTEIQYFNKKGVHTKTESRTGYSCEGDVCNAEVMRMVDHSRNDASTELVRREWTVNTGVDDALFSVRSLQN